MRQLCRYPYVKDALELIAGLVAGGSDQGGNRESGRQGRELVHASPLCQVGCKTMTKGFYGHRSLGTSDNLIQSRFRGGRQGCLDILDGLVCTLCGSRCEAGAGSSQGLTNR